MEGTGIPECSECGRAADDECDKCAIGDLQPIEKGNHGWKVRRLELLILDSMNRATQPNTGWDIWQKIKLKTPSGGDEVCVAMESLADRGYLRIEGKPDPDCGWFYVVT